ncbi:D-inositol 3-phosphate glycosyltransferase [Anaerolineae bacterium]|nr:D-inositol 3-phosphate glycosyltransferase [Anaerolineae bacterium]
MSRFFLAFTWNQTSLSLHFQAFAKELVRRGHKVTILIPNQKHNKVSTNTNPAILTWPSKRPTSFRDAMFLARLISQDQPDCLIANFGAANVMMIVGWLLRIRTRVVYYRTLSNAIEDSPKSTITNSILHIRKRLVYHVATHVAANSIAAALDVQRVYRVRAGKCVVQYNSLSDSLINHSIVSTKDNTNIVCVGKLCQNKGQATLLRAVSLLRPDFPKLRCVFIGEGPSRTEYESLSSTWGVNDICSFEGLQPPRKVLDFMQQAPFTVVPSLSEAFGMVAVESFAVGTPVIASNVGGLPEIVRDGVDGFLVPANDPQVLAERMAILLRDTIKRNEMSRRAREHFLSTFEQERILLHLADWAEELTRKNG